jgi:tetratricopeptide (TPR) repeat protein
LLLIAGWRRAPRERAVWITASALFAAGLLPVLGFIPFEFQAKSTTADHYLYAAMLGVSVASAEGMRRLSNEVPRRAGAAIVVAVIAALAALSFGQAQTWRDSRSLFEQALRVNPHSYPALLNAATLALDDARVDEGLAIATRLAGSHPHDLWSQLTLGRALASTGQLEQALAIFSDAARRWPDRAEAHGGLAAVYLDLGRASEAVAAYDAALRIDPGNPVVHELRRRAVRSATSSSPSTQP